MNFACISAYRSALQPLNHSLPQALFRADSAVSVQCRGFTQQNSVPNALYTILVAYPEYVWRQWQQWHVWHVRKRNNGGIEPDLEGRCLIQLGDGGLLQSVVFASVSPL